MNKYEEIGRLLHKIKKSKQFVEITCNWEFPDYTEWNVTGYSGYDASWLSSIGDTEDGKNLKKLLNGLDNEES